MATLPISPINSSFATIPSINLTTIPFAISDDSGTRTVAITRDGNIDCTSINRIDIDEVNAKMDALISTVDKMVERINDQVAQEGGELLRTVTQVIEMNRTL